VRSLRHLILDHGHLAVLVCLAALALRMLMPAGYMLSGDGGRIAIIPCSGIVLESGMAPAMPVADHATARHAMPGHDTSREHGKAEMPCAFSGLSAPLLGGADLVLLVLALAFVAAMALRASARAPVRTPAYLRPPLRGPPLFR